MSATAVKKEGKDLYDNAFKLEREIISCARRTSETVWKLGEHLYKFQELGGWSLLGYETLEEFLAQPDLGMRRTQFFRLTKLWRDLVVTRKVPPRDLKGIEPAKVDEVRQAIMDGKVKPEDALDDAKALGRRDLRDKYNPQTDTKQKPDDSEPLDASDEPNRVQCKECGSWYIPEEENDGEAADDADPTDG